MSYQDTAEWRRKRAIALAEDNLAIELNLERRTYDHHGLIVYENDDGAWAVCQEGAVGEALLSWLEEEAWTLDADWLAEQLDVYPSIIEAVQQRDQDNSNNAIVDLIETVSSKDDIASELVPDLLADYDGDARQITVEDSDGDVHEYLVFRID